MTVHSKIKNMLSSIFKELNCWIYCPCDTIHKGIPDMLILSMNGKFIAVEIKVGKDWLTALQSKTLTDILLREGKPLVVYCGENELVVSFYQFIIDATGKQIIESVVLFRSGYPSRLMGKALGTELAKIL